MTSQTSEDLRIDHPDFDPGDWALFGIIRGEPAKENYGWGSREDVYQADPGQPPTTMTANWKGYTEEWRITEEGRLVLVAFDYDDRAWKRREVNETITGDFYLVLKSDFEGPRIYVPFRDGVIVLDRARWLHEAYYGASPVDTELRPGCHPDFPKTARLWYQLGLPDGAKR
jgi:hypothetical protein